MMATMKKNQQKQRYQIVVVFGPFEPNLLEALRIHIEDVIWWGL